MCLNVEVSIFTPYFLVERCKMDAWVVSANKIRGISPRQNNNIQNKINQYNLLKRTWYF
jgi:hypothetical protein